MALLMAFETGARTSALQFLNHSRLDGKSVSASKGRIALRPYHPSARRGYQPAALRTAGQS
jgi:hypothetical protein